MKKKIVVYLIMALLLMQSYPLESFAEETDWQISIIVTKNDFDFSFLNSDSSPVLKNDTTLVPLRAIVEAYNFNVLWNEREQSIVLESDYKNIKMWVNSTKIIVNEREEILSVAPVIINDRTFIPLRYVCEYFDLHVLWEQTEKNTAYIWISPFKLLDYKDVEPDDNYYRLDEDIPYYELKNSGKTLRGIGIGNTYDEIVEKYGIPHKKTDSNIVQIEYYTPYLPDSSSGSTLILNLKNNCVTSVELDY